MRLTARGGKLLARATPRHAGLLAKLTGCLRPRDKRVLIRLLTKLRRELRRRKEKA
jgi:hypothetical protein